MVLQLFGDALERLLAAEGLGALVASGRRGIAALDVTLGRLLCRALTGVGARLAREEVLVVLAGGARFCLVGVGALPSFARSHAPPRTRPQADAPE
ncbi:MAG: hypothetical protein H0V19_10510 [Euzebyales bacterium]|nr:hypothetical protein [Euzebyales bacterium]MBA3621190.1 hypothetical protein [Euzebyales bacterium]